jgi:hypothetical protein
MAVKVPETGRCPRDVSGVERISFDARVDKE